MSQMLRVLFPVFPLLFAILTHGLGHLIAARMVGVRMPRLTRTPTGFRLIAAGGFPSYEVELYCALGGPLANMVASLLCRGVLFFYPLATGLLVPAITVSLYLGLFNLLPISGFDGARILHCLLCCRHRHLSSLSPTKADRLISVISSTLLLLFWLIALYLLLRRGSALSLYLFCLQLFQSTVTDDAPTQKQEFGRIRENTEA